MSHWTWFFGSSLCQEIIVGIEIALRIAIVIAKEEKDEKTNWSKSYCSVRYFIVVFSGIQCGKCNGSLGNK